MAAPYLHDLLEERWRDRRRCESQSATLGLGQVVVLREAEGEDPFFRHLEVLRLTVRLLGAKLKLVASAESKRLQPLVIDLPTESSRILKELSNANAKYLLESGTILI